MRNRSAVVILENEKVLLIQRNKDNSIYYVFPGGGIESGETPKEAAKREALEELGIEVNVKDRLTEVDWNGTQYFFLAEIISGTIGTGTGEEYNDQIRGTYTPMWIEIKSLSSMNVLPQKVVSTIHSISYKYRNYLKDNE